MCHVLIFEHVSVHSLILSESILLVRISSRNRSEHLNYKTNKQATVENVIIRTGLRNVLSQSCVIVLSLCYLRRLLDHGWIIFLFQSAPTFFLWIYNFAASAFEYIQGWPKIRLPAWKKQRLDGKRKSFKTVLVNSVKRVCEGERERDKKRK